MIGSSVFFLVSIGYWLFLNIGDDKYTLSLVAFAKFEVTTKFVFHIIGEL